MTDQERIKLMKELEITEDDILEMVGDLLEYTIGYEMLDGIICDYLDTWHRDQSNIGS